MPRGAWRADELPHHLQDAARALVNGFNTLLNGTVCNGVRLTGVPSYTSDEGAVLIIGYDISRTRTVSRRAMPLGLSARRDLWLGFSMRLTGDEEDKYLMVSSSVMYVATAEEGVEPLFHIDYERDKSDGYPEAHLQVDATSPEWEMVRTVDGEHRELPRLHFPAGGRRYRTTLEDLITFLVRERLVKPRAGWEDVVAESAEAYATKQLRAAVRADPWTAIQALQDHPPEGVDLQAEFAKRDPS